jgi:hypothetical protein
MPYEPDLVVRTADDAPVAIVELKGASEVSQERAIALFARYRASAGHQAAPYFLLITESKGFLWSIHALHADLRPNAEFGMKEVLWQYIYPDQDLRGLNYIVFHWLLDTVTGTRKHDAEADKKLRESGFTEAARNAKVTFGMAA